MSKDNGGPAFPVADPRNLDLPNLDEYYRAAAGMDLRDYFAAKAMQGISGKHAAIEVVRAAYEIADLMILERAK